MFERGYNKQKRDGTLEIGSLTSFVFFMIFLSVYVLPFSFSCHDDYSCQKPAKNEMNFE